MVEIYISSAVSVARQTYRLSERVEYVALFYTDITAAHTIDLRALLYSITGLSQPKYSGGFRGVPTYG